MKKEKQRFARDCEDAGSNCFFCPSISDCPKSDFPSEKERSPESKVFPFVEEMLYGKNLPFGDPA